ncbi:MAG: 4-hydroxy-3-methylbut-2-en-1-yl diphosphate synthase [Pelagibacteraceae bacterium]|nr:4-hydroxy-3-methylbut-2-en-1-yl diphosphate synthase [Pelagibacteraceae bacterium]PPR50336.1 MAG: 4-hydroxy-3-methylbut-2-en-1-yl diphosphate synthase (flavodoxin) [Alphaproteobacteria bacterium MarineAlpha5_Bin10]|tara:strand:+ start:7550 stop:8638 length:1089 start_codon:yes stop_codon:yes gene_type:complete
MHRSYQLINRRKSKKIKVGTLEIGGDAPISVQSMTNTLTSNTKETINQIRSLENVGADLIRVSVPDTDSTESLKKIVKESNVPIIADVHFHYKRAIESAKAGASCLRVNPGNIGKLDKIKDVIKAAKDYDCAIRIGVNGGSLERGILEKFGEPVPEALVESATNNIKILEDNDFNKIKVSVKASDVFLAVASYRKLAEIIDYPLHLGITEAGGIMTGSIKSAIGIGSLLYEGIGDTVRVSLSDDPIEEIKVGFEILKALGLRKRGVTIISCPSCARQQFDVIDTVKKLEKKLEYITKPITVSIIGCVVNGPGEATMTNIGITGGGNKTHMIYIDGKKDHRISNENLVDYLTKLIEKKVENIN